MNVKGTDAGNKIAKANGNGGNQPTLKQWVTKMADQIKCALPTNITPERMTRIALTALSKDAKLSQSTPESFIGALLTSAQLGLECNTPLGQAYLIPFYNSKNNVLKLNSSWVIRGCLICATVQDSTRLYRHELYMRVMNLTIPMVLKKNLCIVLKE